MQNHETQQKPQLGELLVAAGSIKSHDLESYLSQAKSSALPLGILLIRKHLVTSEFLKIAIDLQSLIRDKMVSQEISCRALRDIVSGRNTVWEIRESLDLYSRSVQRCLLGKLLLDAGLINERVLGSALDSSEASIKPLGHTLIQQGALAAEMLGAALQAQRSVRARLIPYEPAVIQLVRLCPAC